MHIKIFLTIAKHVVHLFDIASILKGRMHVKCCFEIKKNIESFEQSYIDGWRP